MYSKPLVIGIGEFLWDVLPTGRKAGGAPVNFAYHASQNGVEGWAVSAVGNYDAGRDLLAITDSYGIRTLIATVNKPTGTVDVALCDGPPSYTIHEHVAWDYIPLTEEMLSLAHRAGAICFGTLAQRNQVSRQTIHRFLNFMPDREDTYKIFDINLRQGFYTKEIITESMERCNILKINDEELIAVSRLFGYPGIDLQNKCWLLMGKYNLRMLILTCGVNGSYVFTPGHVSFVDTPHVEVVDTVGAGDSFTGAFIASIMKGKSPDEAHKLAVRVSAYVCTQNGAMPKLPEEYLI